MIFNSTIIIFMTLTLKKSLPYELEEYIISFLPFEKTLNYPFICKQKYNPEIHNWDWAVWNGNLDVLKLYFGEGHLTVVKWFYNNRTSCTKCALNLANARGHRDVVKWLSDSIVRCTLPSCTENCLISDILLKIDNELKRNKVDGY